MKHDMRIIKILNNNVVLALDERNQEQIVTGLGIAWKRKAGDRIDPDHIDKVFYLRDDKQKSWLSELLTEIPPEVIATTEKIVALAKTRLPGELHDSLYITLAEHCHFALQRHQLKIDIRNVLLWEIKKLHAREFSVGLDALKIIAQRLGIQLPEDEAGFIALHLVNAQLTNAMPEAIHITKLTQEILQIAKYSLGIEYDEESLSYRRFMTHLKFFSQRMLGHRTVSSEDESLYLIVKKRYSLSYACVQKIDRHMINKYKYALSNEEKMFLTIHIECVRRDALSLPDEEHEA